MDVDGGCLCGAIAYLSVADSEGCVICHCQNCQINSGTAFGRVVHSHDRRGALASGSLTIFETIAESGRRRCLSFCGDCGTRIYAQTPDQPDAFSELRIDTIRQRQLLTPKQQVWCRPAQPWPLDLAAVPRNKNQDRWILKCIEAARAVSVASFHGAVIRSGPDAAPCTNDGLRQRKRLNATAVD
ncbi:GFA family protein [uncultured Roseobacter sp.]|uniref:GFA family protein n=1 Tax=uncultured Roseobacter sp. TaxID=114847 RepID=UPI00262C1EE5|nr:GFA family protein [uncultured Roseobacter sp.]